MLDDPRKLKPDPIAEALFEVRFESSELGELVVGKLGAHEMWKGFSTNRLPVADVPAPLRRSDENLAHQALLERRSPDGTRVVKIGERVFSYHVMPPYPGWRVLEPELSHTIELVFGITEGFEAHRFGFRYLNVFTPDHFVKDITALNFEIVVSKAPLHPPLNLNYLRSRGELHSAMVRLASREFVQRPTQNFSALADIDVFTPEGFRSADVKFAKMWVSEAHVFLKDEFFGLLTDELQGILVEKG